MVKHFYCTVLRDKRIGWLVGPFASEPEARQHVLAARMVAQDIDPRCAFDLFGVTGVETDNPPAGVINNRVLTP